MRDRFAKTFARLGRLCYVGAWLALLGGVGFGLHWCRGYALSLPAYNQPVKMNLADLPEWLQSRANKHIVDQIIRAAGIAGHKSLGEPDLPLTVATNLSQCPWVRQVVSVQRRPDGVLEVRCEYRQPLAWVRLQGKCYLVDDQAVRLPGEYEPALTAGTGLLTIIGVADPPPEVGRAWPGNDLTAAIRLARLIQGRPVQRQISAIVVHNYAGRTDPLSPDIELATDRPGSIIRWGHAPGEELPTEPTAEQKLTLLEHYLQTYGRVDLGRSYIDIRTWPAFQGPAATDEGPKGNVPNRDIGFGRART